MRGRLRVAGGVRSFISLYSSADQGLLKEGGRGEGDGACCGDGEGGSRGRPMSSNDVITSSIASLNGEGVFPFMSD